MLNTANHSVDTWQVESEQQAFESINTGFNTVFKVDQLSVGLVVPIENYSASEVPTMEQHVERVILAEQLGFAAVWVRDVPFNVPSFGDAGQIYDPFVYLGLLAGQTSRIALGTGSIVLPLRHPAHVAKAAASSDVLSNGRLILGIASGDRAEEYPAMNMSYSDRGERFREGVRYIRDMAKRSADFSGHYGHSGGYIDMLPKPTASKVPLLITGASQQSARWIAEHGDGWMVYPRDASTQGHAIENWRKILSELKQPLKPIMQPLYIDLMADPNAKPQPIHLGLRLGVRQLKQYLHNLQQAGVNHVALNLRFNHADIETTLRSIADEVLPYFNE